MPTGTTEVVADLFHPNALAADPLQIFTTDGNLFNVLRLVGVIGTVLLIRRAWWAAPLTILLLGTQVARAVMALRYTETSHTFLLIYSRYLVTYLTLIGGDSGGHAHRLGGPCVVRRAPSTKASLSARHWWPW